jgi:hypothetical protein
MTPRPTALVAGFLLAATAVAAQAPAGTKDPSCRPPAQTDAKDLLRASLTALGAGRLGGAALHVRATDASLENYQSDRTYPPFFQAFWTREWWLQPSSGVARLTTHVTYPGSEADLPETLSAPAAAFQRQDSSFIPAAASFGSALSVRGLDPWAVIADWLSTGQATAAGECRIRDYDRTVLARTGPYGKERLAIDPRTNLPITLDREEPHYLWGQVAVRYVYTNWMDDHGVYVPGSSFRLVDGTAELTRTISLFGRAAKDSTPSLSVPDSSLRMSPGLPRFLEPIAPDTIRVSDTVVLTKNPGYTEGIALLGDTLYVLDATQGEARARADSTLAARLFPGTHPIVVVVTDLAWPHIAGVRYWVARGATIVSHRASRPFLEQVLARRWTRAPDLYERRRGRTTFRFKGVSDSMSLAGGALRLYPIDGPSSEGALLAWVEGDRFLWASDYIQTAQQPTPYTTEVWRAVRRSGLTPERVAAEHLPLTPWTTIDSLARAGGSDQT